MTVRPILGSHRLAFIGISLMMLSKRTVRELKQNIAGYNELTGVTHRLISGSNVLTLVNSDEIVVATTYGERAGQDMNVKLFCLSLSFVEVSV